MFDIAFSEMLIIGVVALVVIGPERLPKVARTVGHLFGRLQRYVAQVKTDINREMEASELSKVKTEFESAARGFQQDIETHARKTEEEIRQVERDIERQMNPAEPAGAATPEASAPATASASPQLELGIGDPAPDTPVPPEPAATAPAPTTPVAP